MENNQPILSICIPTNGIVKWVIPVLDSIYSQGVSDELFEVVVTDNGGKDDLEKAIGKYKHSNFHYYKTASQGFTNQIDAFEKCDGLFCKMLNHRSRMLPGSIEKIISLVTKYKDEKPILYFAEGRVSDSSIIECNDTDTFVRQMSYWVSWSAGVGVWKSDLIDLRRKDINNMFPHTALLFGLRDESKYVIWNDKYEIMADDSGKGGYDVFRTFGVVLLDILTEMRVNGRISLPTFISVKKDLYGFLCRLYYEEVMMPTEHTFVINDLSGSMDVYYGHYYYVKMIVCARLRKILGFIPRAYYHLLGHKKKRE